MRITPLKSSGCWGTVSKTLGLFSDYSKRGKENVRVATWKGKHSPETQMLRLVSVIVGCWENESDMSTVAEKEACEQGWEKVCSAKDPLPNMEGAFGDLGGFGFWFLSFFFVRIQQNALKFKWFFIFYFLAVIRPLVSQTAILP